MQVLGLGRRHRQHTVGEAGAEKIINNNIITRHDNNSNNNIIIRHDNNSNNNNKFLTTTRGVVHYTASLMYLIKIIGVDVTVARYCWICLHHSLIFCYLKSNRNEEFAKHESNTEYSLGTFTKFCL